MSTFSTRNTALAATGVAVAAVLALSGCKGGNEEAAPAKPSSPTAQPSESATQPGDSASPYASDSASTPATGGGAGTAKAGQQFKMGEQAQFPFTYGTTTKGTISLAVTAIEKGEPADLAPFKLGDKVKGMVPYYVRYQVKNVGTSDLSFASVGHVKGHLGDGSEAQELTVIGTFEKCPSDSLPKGFTNGKVQTGCVIALAPSADTKVTSAEYWGDPFTLGKGLTWK
ncbi:hypothetical protein [Streptomyces sp. G-G2]|uniref:hypothetical protein n=1 Tax=Streptomyces sp. G-G2 TaxID=3046201 RepID=UPI0024B8BD25|nr:hypothetical protein [Streptomyces sp. G-G2]MDJ0381873.1 hypothetical protein [Streptomyces sp. G-G2]